MTGQTVFCSRCGRAVPEGDPADENPLCPDCAADRSPADSHRQQPAPPAEGSVEQTLQDILRELKHIVRNQEYEEFSVWNIFGGLVQCVVLFLLFWHYYRGRPDLMWALVLQVFALTLFVMAKK